MNEPRLEPGETWEQRIGKLLNEKDEIELALASAEMWEAPELKRRQREIYFELECGVAHLEAQEQEIDW